MALERRGRPLTAQLATLRAFTYKLSATATEQLPHTASHIAPSLWNCRDLLSSAIEQPKARNETALALNRFRTILSSLLQDRNAESRLAAVLLIKPTIEAGGVQVLTGSLGWIKGLLGILKRPDPPAIKVLAIVTLTRMFMLTWGHSQLVRELTTQNLPAFLSSCINIISRRSCAASELEAALEAFGVLITRHPTIFRAQEALLRPLLLKIASSAKGSLSSDTYFTSTHCILARRLLVAFHRCAPKHTEAKEWARTLEAAVSASHDTCDTILRSVHEHWKPTTGSRQNTVSSSHNDSLEFTGKDASHFGPWEGMLEGCHRLISLLRLIQSHIKQETTGTVALRAGLIVELLVRLSSISSTGGHAGGPVTSNSNYANDERDLMFSVLPGVHKVAMEIQKELIIRFGHALISLVPQVLEMTVAVFGAQGSHVEVRAMVYDLVGVITARHGVALDEQDVKELIPILESCCRDVLVTANGTNTVANISSTEAVRASSTFDLRSSKDSVRHSTELGFLDDSAKQLLPLVVRHIRSDILPSRLRTAMERTAIMAQQKAAIVACATSPQARGINVQPSLLPILAQLKPGTTELELLLRPRLPLIKASPEADHADGILEYDDKPPEAVNGDDSHDDLEYITPNTVAESIGQQIEPEQQPTGSLRLVEEAPQESAPLKTLHIGNKRKEIGTDSREALSKRQRYLPQNDTADTESRTSLHGRKAVHMESVLPPERSLEQTSTIPEDIEASNAPAESISSKKEILIETGDDDSDFEMPPLTMESDSDPEDRGG